MVNAALRQAKDHFTRSKEGRYNMRGWPLARRLESRIGADWVPDERLPGAKAKAKGKQVKRNLIAAGKEAAAARRPPKKSRASVPDVAPRPLRPPLSPPPPPPPPPRPNPTSTPGTSSRTSGSSETRERAASIAIAPTTTVSTWSLERRRVDVGFVSVRRHGVLPSGIRGGGHVPRADRQRVRGSGGTVGGLRVVRAREGRQDVGGFQGVAGR